MAIPIDKARAPAIVIPVLPVIAPAKVTPTAMPSGMLWSVTAKTSIVVFFRWVRGPSGLSLLRCICGVTVSSKSRKPIPRRNPIAGGSHAGSELSPDISIDGMRSDHTEAATITPDANPRSSFSTCGFILLRIRKTMAAPSEVPAKGIIRPIAVYI